MAIFKDTGIPVKRVEVGEGDLLLDIVTKYHGVLNAVAPGARKLKSRKRGNIELGVISNFSFGEGRNRAIIVEAEAKSLLEALRGTPYGVRFIMDILKLSRVVFVGGDIECFSLLAVTLQTADRICCKALEKQNAILPMLREWFYYQSLLLAGMLEPVETFGGIESIKNDLLKMKDKKVLRYVSRLTGSLLADIIGDYNGSKNTKW